MGDFVLLKIAAETGEVQADFFADDMELAPGAEDGIGVHHIGIKAEGGVGGCAAFAIEGIIADVPVNKGNKVPVFQHYPLGNAGGAGGVEQDKQILGHYFLSLLPAGC